MQTHESNRRRLSTRPAAEYIGVAASSLEKDRVLGTLGIPFIKAGRRVLYDTDDLDNWLTARRRTSTSDPGSEAA